MRFFSLRSTLPVLLCTSLAAGLLPAPAAFAQQAKPDAKTKPDAKAKPDAPVWRTGVALLGEPKYAAGFDHYDYVNPDAPKGGLARLAATGTYENFNPVLLTAVSAAGITSYVYQSLMTAPLDEPSTEYGEIAQALRYPDDYSSVTFRLNPKARWWDGQPITPEDVVWSFQVYKDNNPRMARYYHDVVKAEASAPDEVTFSFSSKGNRELPQIMGQLPVLPKHWWLGKDASGRPRDITASTLEMPMGSGPYRIASFDPGRSVTYARVKDWWGADLPTAKGQYNFDTVRFDYYLNVQQLPDQFKNDSYDFRLENRIANWMTLYKPEDVAAIRDGRIVKQDIPAASVGRMQGFAFNLRRPKFQDARVRQALSLVFDFEEMNRTLLFGQYVRNKSYFDGTELAASGKPPQGAELAILNSIKDKVPPQVFTTPYASPVNGTDENRRANFRKALELLRDAGWQIHDGKLTNGAGEVMNIELILPDESLQRFALAYQQSLKRIGVNLTVRQIDESQYVRRKNARDFDMIDFLQGQTLSPGNEQRGFWGSAAADQPASDNVIGIKSPAVDALAERIVYAKDRAGLVAATHALDRVLLAGDYVVPMFTSAVWHTLHWNRFGQPAILPSQSITGGFPDVWWYDQALAAKTGVAK